MDVWFDVCFKHWFGGVFGVGRRALWWLMIWSLLSVRMFDKMSLACFCFGFFGCRTEWRLKGAGFFSLLMEIETERKGMDRERGR